jgi:hypothetical protein
MSTKDILKAFEAMTKKMAKLEKKISKKKASSSSSSDSDAKPSKKGSKRKMPEGVKAWNEEVKAVLAEMLEEGWTHPETGKPAIYKDALTEASRRRCEASPEAKAKYEAHRARVEARQKARAKAKAKKEDSDSDSDSEEEKPKKKTAKKAKKPVLSDSDSDSSSSEEEKKPKKKAVKPATKKVAVPDSDSDSSSSEEEKTPKKKAPAKPKVPDAPKKAKDTVASAPPKPLPLPAIEEEELVIEPWTWLGKTYYKSSKNEVWKMTEEEELGKWVGVYDPVADTIDRDAPEPKYETA